jgi:hypothetical protein
MCRNKGENAVPDTIDVHDLTNDQIEALNALAEFYRQQAKRRKAEETREERENIVFATHPSNVIGKLTRREIYEDR